MRTAKKSLSALLALVMALTAFGGLFTLSVSADDPAAGTAASGDTTTSGDTTGDPAQEEEEKLPDYISDTKYRFKTAEEKLNNIIENLAYKLDGEKGTGNNLWTRKGDYYLYCDAFSGEVIWQNKKTGEMLLTNPYDVGYAKDSATSQKTKKELLSQIVLTYEDAGTDKTMNSYDDACQREQISAKYIHDGLRIEYSMGEVESRKLVPRLIPATRFNDLILSKFMPGSVEYETLLSYYMLKDINAEGQTEAQITELKKQYPITKQMAIYVFDSDASKRELSTVEKIIKGGTTYSYDDMNEDHATTGYQGNDAAPAVFKFGIEYTLADDGSLKVRLAAGGIRYDEDNYQLKSISLLPYFGAVDNNYKGYTFLPDGSGALIENSDTAYTLSGKMYGIDYAYHQITGQNQEVMRLPVFGAVQYTEAVAGEEIDDSIEQTKEEDLGKTDEEKTAENEALEKELGIEGSTSAEEEAAENGDNTAPGTNNPAGETPATEEPAAEEDPRVTAPAYNAGYVAIIEEGESLATLTSTHGGSVFKYSSVYTKFSPRAQDTYDLKNSLSVGGTSYTVRSKRKYTGNYTLRIYMLTDDTMAKNAGVDDYYRVSYVGMKDAYQDYLVAKGELTPLTDKGDNIPLYIESFGALDTEDRIMSIPVTVKTPLTTFDDLEKMYETLRENGVENVNFRLNGFTNGGMISTVPYKVKFVSKVGGNSGYKKFLKYADENNIGVFTDFDFMYASKTAAFDGFSMKKQAVRTIDSRYTRKRVYNAIEQKFLPTGHIAISAGSLSDIYDGFKKNYVEKFDTKQISVSTLGSDLNSDFDRKQPYDRNDSQNYVEDVLTRINEDFEDVMMDGGNSYALKYADHILNISLDSSRFARASKSIPFLAMVLHGYVEYAGSPTNMASDSTYELLKMVENGANPYYMLSYENLSKLKEDEEFNKYYSVNFEYWTEDLAETYKTMNNALGSLQECTVTNHEFLDGERVHDAGETGDFSIDSGTIVRVEYSNGTAFYINYNDYAVKASDGTEIPANMFIKK